MSQTLTEHDTKRAMEVLNKVLGQIFLAGPMGPQGKPTATPLVEISGVVGAGIIQGAYPLINMFLGMMTLRNPESSIFLAVTVAAIVEALREQVAGAGVKQ